MADKFTPHKARLEERYTQMHDFNPATFNLWVQNFRNELDAIGHEIANAYSGLTTSPKEHPIYITPHGQGDYLFVVRTAGPYVDPDEFNTVLWLLTQGNLLTSMRGRTLYGVEMVSPQPHDVVGDEGKKLIRTPSFVRISYALGTPSGVIPGGSTGVTTRPALGQMSTPRYNGDIFLKQWGAQFPYFLLRRNPQDESDVMDNAALEDIREPFAQIMKSLYGIEEKPATPPAPGTSATPATGPPTASV